MTVPAEMAFVADRLDQEGKPFTAGCIRRLLAEAAEERAARLKAEAERDEMQVGGRKAIETCARVIVERDGLRARLSRAREGLVRAESAVDNSDYGHWRSEGLEALAKVRAALAEPLGGDA